MSALFFRPAAFWLRRGDVQGATYSNDGSCIRWTWVRCSSCARGSFSFSSGSNSSSRLMVMRDCEMSCSRNTSLIKFYDCLAKGLSCPKSSFEMLHSLVYSINLLRSAADLQFSHRHIVFRHVLAFRCLFVTASGEMASRVSWIHYLRMLGETPWYLKWFT